MEENETNEITITTDDGTEELFKVLFFYDNPERDNKRFYFLYREETPEDVIVLGTTDGESFEYLSEEEQEEAEEMFNTYMDDPKISEARK